MKVNMLSVALALASLAIGLVSATFEHSVGDPHVTVAYTTSTTTECPEEVSVPLPFTPTIPILTMSLSVHQSTYVHQTAYTSIVPISSEPTIIVVESTGTVSISASTEVSEQPSVFSTVSPSTSTHGQSTFVTSATVPGSTQPGLVIVSTSGNDVLSETSIKSTSLSAITTSVSDHVEPTSTNLVESTVTTTSRASQNQQVATDTPLINPLRSSATPSELPYTATKVTVAAPIPPVTEGVAPVVPASPATSNLHLIGSLPIKSTSFTTTFSTTTVTSSHTTVVTLMLNPTYTSPAAIEDCVSTVYITVIPPYPSSPPVHVQTVSSNSTTVAATGVPNYNLTTPNHPPINAGATALSATPALLLAVCGLIGYLI